MTGGHACLSRRLALCKDEAVLHCHGGAMHRRLFTAGLAAVALSGAAKPMKAPTPEAFARTPETDEHLPAGKMVFFGCQPGGKTLDNGTNSRGNPFATAFISALSADQTLEHFAGELREKTRAESRGYQIVDLPTAVVPGNWRPVSKPPDQRRTALVLIVTDYANEDQLPPLHGARYDAVRVTQALIAGGYRTTLCLDGARTYLEDVLVAFSRESQSAEAAIVYTTGHGLEVGHDTRLLMQDFDTRDGVAGLASRALPISRIAEAAQARSVNMIFYAGCRNNPGGW